MVHPRLLSSHQRNVNLLEPGVGQFWGNRLHPSWDYQLPNDLGQVSFLFSLVLLLLLMKFQHLSILLKNKLMQCGLHPMRPTNNQQPENIRCQLPAGLSKSLKWTVIGFCPSSILFNCLSIILRWKDGPFQGVWEGGGAAGRWVSESESPKTLINRNNGPTIRR